MTLPLAVTLALTLSVAWAEPPAAAPRVISASTTLDPAKTYGAIEIRASNIVIDGGGAWLVGPAALQPNQRKGVAVSAKGQSGVTLKNVKARGWEIGLSVKDGDGWTIEGCDFSDNYHDPEFGWGEKGRCGGIVLSRVSKSTLRGNRANRVWDACTLADSNENLVADNDFSHASNTCLKLWTACRNRIEKNNLSYGLRIKPGEVHARDSTSVLIESGSNGNRFVGNDCTHGGDGIFVRVLNGWVSVDNHFEQNDCSYANNNGFEAWSPRNTYINNKANRCSYGFWLGASDQTVLVGNEANENGLPSGFHNSPHLPGAGHAGIVFMFGPSSHTVLRDNRCERNNGAGIALIGDMSPKSPKFKAFHWILERNQLSENRWGIYAAHADWIDMAGNRFTGNGEDLRIDGPVSNLAIRPEIPSVKWPPKAALAGPASATTAAPVVFDASASRDPAGRKLVFRWDLGDGAVATTARVEHRFTAPGFYRVGLTVNNAALADLAWRDFYVTENLPELSTEGQAAAWSWVDPQSKVQFTDDAAVKICGKSSVAAYVYPYSGGLVHLLYPASRNAGWSTAGKKHLVFWLRAQNENVPAWQGPNPIVTLYESETSKTTLTPADDFLSQRKNNEEREGWSYFVVPLAGDAVWKREGAAPQTINAVSIGVDSWGAPPLRIWIDGLGLK